MSLTNKVEQFNNDSDLVHVFAHGDKNTVIQTEGGPVPSLTRLADGIQTRLNETIEQQRVLEQRLAANSGATLVKTSSGRNVQEELNGKANINGSNAQDFYSKSLYAASGIVANGNNQAVLRGASGTASPSLQGEGAGTDVGLYFGAKGGGRFDFFNASGRHLQIGGYTASNTVINYARVYGNLAGGNPTFAGNGSDANVGIDFAAQGAGEFVYRSNAGVQFVIGNQLNAVNYLRVIGGATGNAANINAQGSDPNIGIILQPKGAGSVIMAPNGSISFTVVSVANAANYVQASGAIAGAAPVLAAVGASTNIDLNLNAKGTGVIRPGSDIRTSNSITIDASTGERRLGFTTAGGTAVYHFVRNLDGAVGLYDATGGNNVSAYIYTPSTKVMALGGGGVAVTVPAPAVGDNSSRAAPTSWVNAAIAAGGGGGGGRVLLQEVVVSSATLWVDFLNFITPEYDTYVFEARDYRNPTGGSAPRLEFMAGANPITTSSCVYNAPGGTTQVGVSSNILLSSAGLSSGFQPGFDVVLYNANVRPAWYTESVHLLASDGTAGFWDAAGYLTGITPGTATGLRFRWSSTHNTTAGTFRVYGLKKS